MPEYEFSLILIFSYGRFCPYTGKYGSEKARTSAYFTQWNTDDSLSQSIIFGPEAVARRFSVKNVFLKILQNSQENTCARGSFLIKLQAKACKLIKKETLAQVFSCEFCEIFKNNFFYRTLPVAASDSYRIMQSWWYVLWNVSFADCSFY